eukprot:scaffold65166_cov76-Cyclotella_meneghiniana.AAC.3
MVEVSETSPSTWGEDGALSDPSLLFLCRSRKTAPPLPERKLLTSREGETLSHCLVNAFDQSG